MENGVFGIKIGGISEGGEFPEENTGMGADISPEFVLTGVPAQAAALAVTLEDVSHPVKNFTHWVIWNIPAADIIKGNIPRGRTLPDGSVQGIAYGMHGYAGPKPPKGKTHSYRFTVYALDCMLELKSHSTKRAFLKKAEGHIIRKGSVTASCRRQ